jgi:membrane-bound lytic murein transglycosylase D
MNAKAKKTALVLLIIGPFVAWSCSSGPKPAAKPKPPAVSKPAGTSAASQTQAQPPAEPAKTSIPAMEIEIPPALPESGTADKAVPPEKDSLSAMMDEAFVACEEAETLREKGDFEEALAALDGAYALLLKMDLPADSPLAQEKSDLRLMIAKRIQTIHASRLVPPKENHKTIPLVENRYVLQEIASFQTKERKAFEEAYERSGLYRDMIIQEFRQAGIPDELSWLPMIESWYKVRALSVARALGMWQFISSTGSLYDLKRDRYIDERMDPVKETRAAARYLSDLHSLFGDWTTALAAYNCGEFRVQRVIRSQQIDYLDNFWDLFAQLPYETARFVPRFIAAQLILNDPAKYGFNLPAPYPPLAFETVKVRHATKLSSLSTAMGLDPSEMAFLNPELRYDATPDYEYELKVPVGCVEKCTACIASLPKWVPPEATYVLHRVRNGETLGLIAQRYHTSVTAIVRLNGLKSSRFIRAGWTLKVPGRGAAPASGAPVVGDNRPPRGSGPSAVQAQAGPDGTYMICSGDTAFSIAKRFGLSLDDFLALNGLSMDSVLTPGQTVKVKSSR